LVQAVLADPSQYEIVRARRREIERLSLRAGMLELVA
jgi:hypothetical protein